MKFQSFAENCREGSETASGIHVVPEPRRSIVTPSGSGTIAMCGIESVMPRTPFVVVIDVSRVPGL